MTLFCTTKPKRLIKKLPIAAGAALALCSLGPAAQAQSPVPPPTTLLPTTGTKEIGASANLSFNGDNPFAVSASYGQFITEPLEVGIQGYVAGANHTRTSTNVGGIVDYYFRQGANPLLPYVGAFAGYADNGDNHSGSVGAQAGLKYFLNPSIAVTGELQYRAVEHTSGTTDLLVGLSTFFH